MAAETVETVVPEPVEHLHPLPHLVEALGVEVVATLTTVALLAHQTHAAQHRDAATTGRLNGTTAAELVDGLVAASEGGDERAAYRVAIGAEGVGDGGAPAGDMPTLYVGRVQRVKSLPEGSLGETARISTGARIPAMVAAMLLPIRLGEPGPDRWPGG